MGEMDQINPAAAAVEKTSFKVLTVNIHKGFAAFNRRFMLHELREAVRSVSADIVFLQEVLGEHEMHKLRHETWPSVPQYEFLADSIWKDFAYGRNAVYTGGHHGNAVLSKFPILQFYNQDVSLTGPERRGLLHCRLQLPDPNVQVHAMCVHLSLRESHRQEQFRQLCNYVNKNVPETAPLIVAGDFNDWRTRGHRALSAGVGLREAFVEATGQAARTFPARFPILRLDRIYFRHLRVFNPTVYSMRPWSHLSDHSALYAELQLE